MRMQHPFQCLVSTQPANTACLLRYVSEMHEENAREYVIQIFAELVKPDFKITQTAEWINFVNRLLSQLIRY